MSHLDRTTAAQKFGVADDPAGLAFRETILAPNALNSMLAPFGAYKFPRWEPYAGNPRARICAGGRSVMGAFTAILRSASLVGTAAGGYVSSRNSNADFDMALNASASVPAKRGWLAAMFSPRRQSHAIPENLRVYAIGDIHGCVRELDQLHQLIAEDSRSAKAECQIVYLGDYVDRGPDSKGVVDRLLHPPEGFDCHYIRGNHDQTVLDFLEDPLTYGAWKQYGAPETLASYGVKPPRFEDEAEFRIARDDFEMALPQDHLQFLKALPLTHRIGDYLFVHAGLRPGIQVKKQVAEDLLWIRDEFLDSTVNFGAVVVHGHTPTERPVLRRNRIGVDTGAYATGRLTSVVLEGETIRFLHT